MLKPVVRRMINHAMCVAAQVDEAKQTLNRAAECSYVAGLNENRRYQV